MLTIIKVNDRSD